VSSQLRTGLRAARTVAIVVMATACGPTKPVLSAAAVSALGARDGYVFVVSPFNCSLNASQIDALNDLARRTRRSGVILAAGGAAVSDSVAAAAIADLGIRMRTRRLAESDVDRALANLGWRPPIVIALQHGEIVGTLSGEHAQMLDTWIPWLERQPLSPTAPGMIP
jgi:hypothetical protein